MASRSERAKMQKPINRVAIVLWALAALSVVYLYWFVRAGTPTDIVIAIFRGVTNGIAPLVGLGVIIELLDQIRWNALPPEQRKPALRFKL
jgi:hypothetical protein